MPGGFVFQAGGAGGRGGGGMGGMGRADTFHNLTSQSKQCCNDDGQCGPCNLHVTTL
jgi:hypothetical protein